MSEEILYFQLSQENVLELSDSLSSCWLWNNLVCTRSFVIPGTLKMLLGVPPQTQILLKQAFKKFDFLSEALVILSFSWAWKKAESMDVHS